MQQLVFLFLLMMRWTHVVYVLSVLVITFSNHFFFFAVAPFMLYKNGKWRRLVILKVYHWIFFFLMFDG